MTDKKFYDDPYLREYDSFVISCVQNCNAWDIVLNSTIFYPTGGGQPCDLGTIGTAYVSDVREDNGEIIHRCDSPISVGSQVHSRIDWDRRFSLMQNHSGEHIVSGVIHNRFGYENIGFHMGHDVLTIDFSGFISNEQLASIEDEVNQILWHNIPSEITYPSPTALKEIAYRSKKELTGRIRLVTFGNIDTCACCGLHVGYTGEIGLVKLISTTKFHNGSRIELLCGRPAFNYLNAVCSQNKQTSVLLSSKALETYKAVQKITEEYESLKNTVIAYENELLKIRASRYCGENLLVIVDDLSPNLLRKFSEFLIQNISGFCLAVCGSDKNFKYVLCSSESNVLILSKQINLALQGRGGGKPNFVQGILSCNRESIIAFWREAGYEYD